jgi:hypothetical protein
MQSKRHLVAILPHIRPAAPRSCCAPGLGTSAAGSLNATLNALRFD